jgi:DNA-binding response OmpR family regulator
MLEQSTEETNYSCAFTVVPNAFIALECSEYTCYDLIIAKKDMQHLGARDMLNVLHAVGSPTPVVLLLDEHDNSVDHDAQTVGFFSVLRKPLSTRVLCNLIETIMNRHSGSKPLQPAAAVHTQAASSILYNGSDAVFGETSSSSSRSASLVASDTCDFKRLQTAKSTKSNMEGVKSAPEKVSASTKLKRSIVSTGRLHSPEVGVEIQDRSRVGPSRSEGDMISRFPDNIHSGSSEGQRDVHSSTVPTGPYHSTRPKIGPAVTVNEYSCLDEELLQMEGIRASPCARSKNPLSPLSPSGRTGTGIGGSRAPRHVQVFPAESRLNASETMQMHNFKYPHSQGQGQGFELSFEQNQNHSNTGPRSLYSPARESFLESTRNIPGVPGAKDLSFEAVNSASTLGQNQNQYAAQKKVYEQTQAAEIFHRGDSTAPLRQGQSMVEAPSTGPSGRNHVQQSSVWDPKQAAEQLVKEWSSAKSRVPNTATLPAGSTLYPSLKSINTALLAVESNGRTSGVAVNHSFLRHTQSAPHAGSGVGMGTGKDSPGGQTLPSGHSHSHSLSLHVDTARHSIPKGGSVHPLYALDPNCESTTSSGLPTPSPSPSMFNYSSLSSVPPPPLTAAVVPRPASPFSSFTLLSPTDASAGISTGSGAAQRLYPFSRNAPIPIPVPIPIRRLIIDESVQTGRQINPNPAPNPTTSRSEFGGRKRAPTGQGGYDTFSEK